MASSSGVIGQLLAYGAGGAEKALVDGLFEFRNLKRMKQLTEVTPDLMFPLVVAGMIQRRFRSKVLLSMLEELFLLEVSKDRKGRDEYAEVALAVRRGMEGGGELE